MKFLKSLSFERGLQILVGLNLVDALATDVAIRFGVATELNPLLAWIYAINPALFWIVKVGLIVGSLALLALAPVLSPLFNKDPKSVEASVRTILLLAIGLYLFILLNHVVGWLGLLL